MPVVGLLIYAAAIWRLTGDPLAWAKGHAAWGRTYEGLTALVMQQYAIVAGVGLSGYVGAPGYDVLNALGALFAIATVWPVARRIGLAYGVFMLINILPALSTGGLLSAGRFLVGAVPGVRVARRRDSTHSASGLDRELRGAPSLQRRVVLHVASALLNRVSRYPLLGATALLIALTIILTWPQVLFLGSKVADHGDPLLSIWRVSWIAHVLPGDIRHLFDANIFHPHLRTLAYSDATLLEGLIALP